MPEPASPFDIISNSWKGPSKSSNDYGVLAGKYQLHSTIGSGKYMGKIGLLNFIERFNFNLICRWIWKGEMRDAQADGRESCDQNYGSGKAGGLNGFLNYV